MKIPTDCRKRGFTLVELLVVIAIIAVLASASFIVANQAIQKAHMVTALAASTAIEKAVMDFSTEYGSVPSDQPEDIPAFETDKASGKDLVTVLLGKETSTTPKNTKALPLLTVKEGKKLGTGGTKGIIYDNDIVTGLYDPWGNGYFVMIDSDSDEDETVNPPQVGNDPPITTRGVLHRRVAVWSAGADKDVGGVKNKDDFKSW